MSGEEVRALIVARTKVGSERCIGAIDRESGESLRLLGSAFNPNREYECYEGGHRFHIGEMWKLKIRRPKRVYRPHLEDVVVVTGRKIYKLASLQETIEGFFQPSHGPITEVFRGAELKTTREGSAYFDASDPPPNSTEFWYANQDLERVDKGRGYGYEATARGNFGYGWETKHFRLSYRGEPLAKPVIPAGTLVRLSLARPWRPPDADDSFPKRCYMQISGWYDH